MNENKALWPPQFSGAIFDFDGTIAQSAEVWNEVDRIFLNRRGVEWTSDFAPKIAALGFRDGAQYVIDEYGFNNTQDEICDEWNELAGALYPNLVTLRPGVMEYINALKSLNIPVALASTNDNHVIGSLKPRIDVWDIFDAVVLSNDVTRTKNHPDIYLEAARRIDVKPSECIVFEDIVPGLNSAKRAGMLTVGLRTYDPTQKVEEIKKNCDIYIEDWTSIQFA